MNVELLNHIIAARWNRIVTKRMLYVREEKTHLVFLHARRAGAT